jgi:5-methyltetrahydropteroyltriglutamate--homocysteine methyltransferase
MHASMEPLNGVASVTNQPDLNSIRSDQVGSLLRPAALLEAWERHAAGLATVQELTTAQDEAIRAVIARQESIGMPIVSDGEFRRLQFQDSFGTAVTGYLGASNNFSDWTPEATEAKESGRVESGLDRPGSAISNRLPVAERLRLVHNNILDEYRYAKSVARTPVKVTLVGPDRIGQRFAWEHERSRAIYADMDAFLADVIAIQGQMIAEVVADGCRYVQIDEPGYTAYVDAPLLDRMQARGENPEENVERSIRTTNALFAKFPEVTFGLHMCRGNDRSMWHREGTYDSIAERLFNGLACQRLLLEYDTARAGGFEPLRFVPKGKVVVLGLVTTKAGSMESEDELLQRIDAASKFLSLDQLAISPQCGFASGVHGNKLTEDEQWRKLELVQRVAQRVW